MEFTFTPQAGGTATIVRFDDPDGDGGQAPTNDAFVLAPGEYGLSVRFENGLVSPPEVIAVEVVDESSEHQVVFTGTEGDGPATDNLGAPLLHRYTDMRVPLGLDNRVVARQGEGDLIVTLRHLPPVGNALLRPTP